MENSDILRFEICEKCIKYNKNYTESFREYSLSSIESLKKLNGGWGNPLWNGGSKRLCRDCLYQLEHTVHE